VDHQPIKYDRLIPDAHEEFQAEWEMMEEHPPMRSHGNAAGVADDDEIQRAIIESMKAN
jgi:hypothetical protein